LQFTPAILVVCYHAGLNPSLERNQFVRDNTLAVQLVHQMTTKCLLIASGLWLSLLLSSGAIHAQSSANSKSSKMEVSEPLSHELRHQLLMLPYYSVFDSIDFSISGNTVTLTGQVLRPTLKADAEAAVKSLEGVDNVVNKIEVLPRSATDDELRRDVYRAIFEDPELAKYAVQPVPSIHIIVKNRAVTLMGKVDKETDIALASKESGKVQNVAGVRNLLTVRNINTPVK
jgi:hyperosmotically inducible periplasmic protein